MPSAEASNEPVGPLRLEKCPPDGYVTLRKMNYGQKLHHDGMSSMSVPRPEKGKAVEKVDFVADVSGQIAFALRTCVVEHNLTKRDGTPFNFLNLADVAALDPAVGEEIGTLIDALNAGDDLTASFLDVRSADGNKESLVGAGKATA